MKFGNSELSDWMYVYTSYVEGELGDISWFRFDKSNLPQPPSIVDAIAVSVVALYPITVDKKIEGWLVAWTDEKISKVYWENTSIPAILTNSPDVENVKKEIDKFLIRMNNLIIFA